MHSCNRVIRMMTMAYRFFLVPIRDSGAAAADLNRFLGSHRILKVTRRWVAQGTDSFWGFCVDYLVTGGEADARPGPGGATERPKVDYREKLSAADFGLFVKLRDLRGALAKDEAVALYVVATNEQLAEIAESRPKSKTELGKVAGLGPARLKKYGERLLALVREHREDADASSGPFDGTSGGVGQPTNGVLAGVAGQADQA